jgi:hypothetical protein
MPKNQKEPSTETNPVGELEKSHFARFDPESKIGMLLIF